MLLVLSILSVLYQIYYVKDILYYANFSIIESRPICIYRTEANLYLLHWDQSFYWIEANLYLLNQDQSVLFESKPICLFNRDQYVYWIEANLYNWISRPICIYWIEANLFYLNPSQFVYWIGQSVFIKLRPICIKSRPIVIWFGANLCRFKANLYWI